MPALEAIDWINAGSGILKSALSGGSTPPAGPAISSATQNESFNTSGWTVATGKGSASGANTGYMGYAALGVALVLGILWIRHK